MSWMPQIIHRLMATIAPYPKQIVAADDPVEAVRNPESFSFAMMICLRMYWNKALLESR